MSDLDISRLQQQSYRRGQRDALADMDLAAYLLGQREMLARCIKAVEAIGHYPECVHPHEDGYPCTHEEVIDAMRSLEEKP